MNKKTVSIIPEKQPDKTENINSRIKRVCAYCRVSTDHDEQKTSFENQSDVYRHLICTNQDWQFAGVYADEGVSGTGTKKRLGFIRMIQDCKDGKIDMILTKSISRFARNTVDCLTYLRLLKELNIAVIFEKENINSLDSTGEFVITLLGSLAQEESRNTSSNIRWAIEKNFEKGLLRVPHLFGYTKTKTGELEINPEEADTVKMIFRLYLKGLSLKAICRELENKEILSPKNNNNWDPSGVLFILRNEKYSGNAILQKYFTPDYLQKRTQLNLGQKKKYLVYNSHKGIISRSIFLLAKREIFSRSKNSISLNSNNKNIINSKRFALNGKKSINRNFLELIINEHFERMGGNSVFKNNLKNNIIKVFGKSKKNKLMLEVEKLFINNLYLEKLDKTAIKECFSLIGIESKNSVKLEYKDFSIQNGDFIDSTCV